MEDAHDAGFRSTLDRLRELGCDLAQGYYMGRPMPLAQLADWLETSP